MAVDGDGRQGEDAHGHGEHLHERTERAHEVRQDPALQQCGLELEPNIILKMKKKKKKKKEATKQKTAKNHSLDPAYSAFSGSQVQKTMFKSPCGGHQMSIVKFSMNHGVSRLRRSVSLSD